MIAFVPPFAIPFFLSQNFISGGRSEAFNVFPTSKLNVRRNRHHSGNGKYIKPFGEQWCKPSIDILPPQVRVPSTPFIVKICAIFVFALWKERKINRKEAGIGPLKNFDCHTNGCGESISAQVGNFLNPHSYPNVFYWCHQGSWTLTPANSMQVNNCRSKQA